MHKIYASYAYIKEVEGGNSDLKLFEGPSLCTIGSHNQYHHDHQINALGDD